MNRIVSGPVFIQYACLYRDQEGIGKIRIINYVMDVNDTMNNVFQGADQEVVLNLMLRENSLKLKTHTPDKLTKQLIDDCVDILYTYRLRVRHFNFMIPSALNLPTYNNWFCQTHFGC